jgi:hypothetical protein
VSEKITSKFRRRPNTSTIIKAAKDAGATSVTFPDGTIVSLTPAATKAVDDLDRELAEFERQRA